jgi:riboflavin kinase/FMN adenylyltransferase
LAIGVFDGLHVGHQKLIKAAVKRAKVLGGQVIVMTFFPHPVQVLKPDRYLPFVVSLSYRLKLIECLGAVMCIVVHFTKRFSRLSPRQFVKRYLVDHIRPKEIFVGNDFRFGKDRKGTVEFFKEAGNKYGFHVHFVNPVNSGNKKVGSSHIRKLITEGQLNAAKHYLGRHVSVMGKVRRGSRRGKALGFPTANINPKNVVIPPIGVYAVHVLIGEKKYNGMANVGRRPSFNRNGDNINVEAHIFDFQKELYDSEIIIQFVKKIRNEQVFSSKEQLIAQLRRDQIKTKSILK